MGASYQQLSANVHVNTQHLVANSTQCSSVKRMRRIHPWTTIGLQGVVTWNALLASKSKIRPRQGVGCKCEQCEDVRASRSASRTCHRPGRLARPLLMTVISAITAHPSPCFWRHCSIVSHDSSKIAAGCCTRTSFCVGASRMPQVGFPRGAVARNCVSS